MDYKSPMTCPTTPTTNKPRIITIGETFFLSNHIQNNVNPNAAKPGINWSKLSCNVVTFSGERAKPLLTCSNALLIPSPPEGNLSHSM